MSVILSRRADAEIDRIGEYVRRQGSPRAAEGLVRRILDACASLEDFPERTRAAEVYGRKLRMLMVDPYNIFYRVRGNAVTIVSVRHGSRKPGALRR